MIPETILTSLYCSSTEGDDNQKRDHIIEQPFVLSCGHNVCFKCIKILKQLKCNKCGEKNTNELDANASNQIAKNSIDLYVEDLLRIVEDKLKEKLNEFESNLFKDFFLSINFNFNFN